MRDRAHAQQARSIDRLVDSGLRLNAIETRATLVDFALDEAMRVLAATRGLLVLDEAGSMRVVGHRLPRGEKPAPLFAATTPWLLEARRKRVSRLRHGPDGADRSSQRSCLVVPFVAASRVVGWLYVDVDGRRGRFDAQDKQHATLLGAQVAAAFSRIGELADARREAAQRAKELALINGVQQGIAAKLDFQGIVDLVGNELHAVFVGAEVSIRWWDEKANLIHYLYEFAKGRRLDVDPTRPKPDGFFMEMVRTRQPIVLRNLDEALAHGLTLLPGAIWARSGVSVPILGGDRTLGMILLENYERDDAFSADQVRLLQTIAASLGGALENARLFHETQEALDRQTVTGEILRAIAGAQTDAEPVFETIARSAVALCGGRGLQRAPLRRRVASRRGDTRLRARFRSALARGVSARAGCTAAFGPRHPARQSDAHRRRTGRRSLRSRVCRGGRIPTHVGRPDAARRPRTRGDRRGVVRRRRRLRRPVRAARIVRRSSRHRDRERGACSTRRRTRSRSRPRRPRC